MGHLSNSGYFISIDIWRRRKRGSDLLAPTPCPFDLMSFSQEVGHYLCVYVLAYCIPAIILRPHRRQVPTESCLALTTAQSRTTFDKLHLSTLYDSGHQTGKPIREHARTLFQNGRERRECQYINFSIVSRLRE